MTLSQLRYPPFLAFSIVTTHVIHFYRCRKPKIVATEPPNKALDVRVSGNDLHQHQRYWQRSRIALFQAPKMMAMIYVFISFSTKLITVLFSKKVGFGFDVACWQAIASNFTQAIAIIFNAIATNFDAIANNFGFLQPGKSPYQKVACLTSRVFPIAVGGISPQTSRLKRFILILGVMLLQIAISYYNNVMHTSRQVAYCG